MTASLLPNGRIQIVDPNGVPLNAGQVHYYVPSTTTPKTTWVDAGQTTPNSDPVILDAYGSASVYGDGTYRQMAYDAAGTLIWDTETSIINSPTGAYTYAGTGAVSWTAAGKLDTFATVKDFGAVGSGAVNEFAAFQAAATNADTNSGTLTISSGDYEIDGPVDWGTTGRIDLQIDPRAGFSGTWPFDLSHFFFFQATPIFCNRLLSYRYNTGGYGNIYANATVISQSDPTSNTTAVFAEADAFTGAKVWAFNSVATTRDNSACVAISYEVDCNNMAGGSSQAYGIVAVSDGNYPAENFLQAQCNVNTSTFKNGIMFNAGTHPVVSGAFIKSAGTNGAQYGIDWDATPFSLYDIRTKNIAIEGGTGVVDFRTAPIGGTPSGTYGYMTIKINGVSKLLQILNP